MRVSLWLPLVCLLGCGGGGGGDGKDEFMSPGEDCLAAGCHTDFSFGGTVYAADDAPAEQGLEGVTIKVVDAANKTLTLTSNRTGNFYTKESVTWPASFYLTKDNLSGDMLNASNGQCNACHSLKRYGRVDVVPAAP
jgi:hypothetical protein